MSEKQPESSVYYVMNVLNALKADIISLTETMPASRAGIDKHLNTNREKAQDHYETLQKGLSRLVECVNQSRLCLLETGDQDLAAYAGGLAAQLAAFNLMSKDYSTLVSVLQNYAEKLPELRTTNAKIIGRCMNSVRMGYYPTDLHNVAHILNGVTFPPGVVTNLLDPCCGEGKALKKLAVGNNCFTYGVELDEGRAQIAQQELHRVGFGSFFHSRISHEAFHLIFLNPPYLAVLTEGGNKARDEKRFLIESIPHLLMGGLLVYVIPYYRLTPDICRILCDNFGDISVHCFTADEFKKYNQIVVMGKRIKRTDGTEAATALAELAYAPDKIPCIAEISPGRYPLPAFEKKVELFKGAVFNELELARQLKQSKSFEGLLTNKSLTDTVRRPPLPFSFSQLGLIGGSGLINGLIECDYPHILKGRIVKEAKSESAENLNAKGELLSTEITETVSNRMIFNILTPDGFKALA